MKTFIVLLTLICLCILSSAGSAQETAPAEASIAAGSFHNGKTPEPSAPPAYDISRDDAEMVFIPEGPFIMGTDDEDSLTASRPAHEVTLKGFWIDRYEVSNAQYAKCVKAQYCTDPKSFTSSTRSDYYTNELYADYPVIHVDYYQATAYCTWAGKRLPTEAEWEKAARGEEGFLYPWGNKLPMKVPAQINLFENGDTAPVDSFPKGVSPYGVYNMEGNVWEWTADQYDAFFYSESPAADPRAVTGGNDYVIRGFSWAYPFHRLEITARNYSYILNHTHDLGFRCAY